MESVDDVSVKGKVVVVDSSSRSGNSDVAELSTSLSLGTTSGNSDVADLSVESVDDVPEGVEVVDVLLSDKVLEASSINKTKIGRTQKYIKSFKPQGQQLTEMKTCVKVSFHQRGFIKQKMATKN